MYISTQRGSGIGSILARVFGKLVPFLRTSSTKVLKAATSPAAKRLAKKTLKSAGKSAVKAAGNAVGLLICFNLHSISVSPSR